ncbi:OmpA/MotB family protein [Azospirillum argentinense]
MFEPRSRRRRHSGESGDQDGYFVAFNDLLTGILFIFILLLTAVVLGNRNGLSDRQALETALTDERAKTDQLNRRLTAAQGDLGSRQAADNTLTENKVKRAKLLDRIAEQLKTQGYTVTVDAEAGVLRLPDSLLFGSGNRKPDHTGGEALRLLGGLLEREIRCATRPTSDCPPGSSPFLEAVFVEGHTDSMPVRRDSNNPYYTDNWKLSVERALAAFSEMKKNSPSLERLANAQGRSIFGVGGYADGRAVADNESEGGRESNRRIDLRFLLSGVPRQ